MDIKINTQDLVAHSRHLTYADDYSCPQPSHCPPQKKSLPECIIDLRIESRITK